jgi:hypothetical protein
MIERLFASYGETVPTTAMRRPRKGAIIGAGQVGMACAYSMLIQSTFDEMVLVDIDQPKLEGEVMACCMVSRLSNLPLCGPLHRSPRRFYAISIAS